MGASVVNGSSRLNRTPSDTSQVVRYRLKTTRSGQLPHKKADHRAIGDISAYSQAKLNTVARRLNERPQKTLDFDTPAERFRQFVSSTG